MKLLKAILICSPLLVGCNIFRKAESSKKEDTSVQSSRETATSGDTSTHKAESKKENSTIILPRDTIINNIYYPRQPEVHIYNSESKKSEDQSGLFYEWQKHFTDSLNSVNQTKQSTTKGSVLDFWQILAIAALAYFFLKDTGVFHRIKLFLNKQKNKSTMKNLKLISFSVAILWTVILIFAVIHNTNNERFPVVHFQGSHTEGYQDRLPYYQLSCSPAWAWEHNKSFPVTLGYIFLVLMWVSTIFVALDLHLKFVSDPKSKAAEWIIFSPMILSIVFFFSGYSSRLSNNYVNIEENTFNQWVQDGKIEKRGQDKYIDATEENVLLHSFDNKNIIK